MTAQDVDLKKPEDQDNLDGQQTQDPPAEQTPEQAEASFASGFSKVSKGHEPAALEQSKPAASTDKPDESGQEKQDKQPAQAASTDGDKDGQGKQKPPAKQEQQPGDFDPKVMQKRLRKLENNFGNLNESLSGIKTDLGTLVENIRSSASKATTGTEAAAAGKEASVALARIAKIEESIGDFPELKSLVDELKSIRSDMAQQQKAPAQEGSRESAQQQQAPQYDPDALVERAALIARHPDWEQKTASAEFRQFTLQGGPSEEEYINEYAPLLADPKRAKEADAIVEGWKEDHPQWWQARGKYLFGSVADSITLLDQYNSVLNQQRQSQQQKDRKSQRLERSLTPEGVPGDPPQGLDDEEAFARGFKRVKGSRL